MNITANRTKIIISHLCENLGAEYCSFYGEPGYSEPESGVILCNWNDVSKLTQDYLEEAGYSLEWSDEWTIDYNNDKAYRTSPDSYSWVMQIRYTDDGEMLTPDDDVQTWIDEMCLTDYNQEMKVLPDWIAESDIEECGYVSMPEDFESGMYPGQNDNPKDIAKKAFDNGAQSVVFRIKESSQFYTVFQGFALYD